MTKIIIPAILNSHGSRADGGERLTFVTNELSDEQALVIRSLKQKYGYLFFKDGEVEKEEEALINNLDPVVKPKKMTPSQKLRFAYKRLWELDNEGYADAEEYYTAKIEKGIEGIENKIKVLSSKPKSNH